MVPALTPTGTSSTDPPLLRCRRLKVSSHSQDDFVTAPIRDKGYGAIRRSAVHDHAFDSGLSAFRVAHLDGVHAVTVPVLYREASPLGRNARLHLECLAAFGESEYRLESHAIQPAR